MTDWKTVLWDSKQILIGQLWTREGSNIQKITQWGSKHPKSLIIWAELNLAQKNCQFPQHIQKPFWVLKWIRLQNHWPDEMSNRTIKKLENGRESIYKSIETQ